MSQLAALWNHTVVTAPAPGGGKAPWPTFQSQEMADLIALLRDVRRILNRRAGGGVTRDTNHAGGKAAFGPLDLGSTAS